MKVKNWKIIYRLSLRSMRMSKKRNLIAAIAIALTTLLFTSLFTIALSINSSYETYVFRQLGGYCHGTFKDVSKVQAEAISGHPNVKETGGRVVFGYMSEGKFSWVPGEVSFMDENCAKWSYAKPQKGHQPEGAREVAMDTKALKLLGVPEKEGAEVTLTYEMKDENGMPYKKTDTFTLAGWWEYDDISPVHYINVSEEYEKQLDKERISEGMPPFTIDLNVMMDSVFNVQGQMEQVDKDLGYRWEGEAGEDLVRIGVNWGYTSVKMQESMDASAISVIVLLLVLIILTGYLIIYNIFQISVVGDIRYYGLLKTIGVTPRQLKRIIRIQAFFLCLAGIPVGLITGYGIGGGLMPMVMAESTMGAQTATVSASPFIFLGAALFSLGTVFLSCMRPGRIASRVSPVEAVSYTKVTKTKRKSRTTHGARVYQMALANFGRDKKKTVLVILSLGFSVVLFNVLFTFTNGFSMEKYLEKESCADFIVADSDYFQSSHGEGDTISEERIEEIKKNTTQLFSGCAYTLLEHSPVCWVDADERKKQLAGYLSGKTLEDTFSSLSRRGDLVEGPMLMEGLDESLFQKLEVVKGELSPLFEKGDIPSIAMVVGEDDYENVMDEDCPPIGTEETVTYIDEAYFMDSRTGEEATDETPEEYREYHVEKSHDVRYKICAYVKVPYSMGLRYFTPGYSFVLPKGQLEADSKEQLKPMFLMFDTPDAKAEAKAEAYLAKLTREAPDGLMYESKAVLREEFKSFQKMFLYLGGLLCGVIGLIGILNFLNAVMTSILSRKKEFAMLKAVGMTNRQLRNMLILEGLFHAMGALLLAFVIALILNPLLGNALENIFWFFRARFTILPVLCMLPVFVLLGVGIPEILYGQTVKRSVVEQLREME